MNTLGWQQRSLGQRRPAAAFTLLELLAVIVIMLVLVGILIATAGYVQKRVNISNTRSMISAIEAAVEMYKADFGSYPASTEARISYTGIKESSNNWYLCRALMPASGKVYLRLSPSLIRTNSTTGLLNLYDPWGMPFNYYNSPQTAYGVSNNLNPATCFACTNSGYTVGGQVNVAGVDVFSYGSDRVTYVKNALYAGYGGPWAIVDWTNVSAAFDDVVNWAK